MNRRSVSLVVWHGKAYLPCQARIEAGMWMDIEPVYIADVDVEYPLNNPGENMLFPEAP